MRIDLFLLYHEIVKEENFEYFFKIVANIQLLSKFLTRDASLSIYSEKIFLSFSKFIFKYILVKNILVNFKSDKRQNLEIKKT